MSSDDDNTTSDTERPAAAFPGAHFLDEIEMRRRVADDAREAVGTGSTGPEARQDAYALRLFPDTPNPRLRAQMADSMYSCGLSGFAAMRKALVDAPEMHMDYAKHTGEILEWLADVAKRMSAYVPLTTRAQCEAAALTTLAGGDILVVDGPVHVIVLTDKASDVLDDVTEPFDFITSEGGLPEVDPRTGEHGMCIHSRRMRLRITAAGRLQTGTVNPDGSATWGRLAIYQIACGKLRSTDGI